MNHQIVHIEWGCFESKRPRAAGSNARLNAHGDTIRVPILRLTSDEGASGFGACHVSRERASMLLGMPLSDLFSPEKGVFQTARDFEFALWDLVGHIEQKPVWQLAHAVNGVSVTESLIADCYDTSLYFDDLHLSCDDEAIALIADEARQGIASGHRNFKVKVGRGARHMEAETGTRRDIAIVRAVREVIGSNAALLLDANNGYNLSLTKHVLNETADCDIFWMEEAFHEDAEYLRDLKSWLFNRGLKTLVADGEGDAAPHLLRWAQEGLVDVVQYDIGGYGFSNWLHLGKQLDEWNVRSAPHHYGGHFGNFAACHLAGAIKKFTFAEWDEATTPGLNSEAYEVRGGQVVVPNAPGWALQLDEEHFRASVATNGFELHG